MASDGRLLAALYRERGDSMPVKRMEELLGLEDPALRALVRRGGFAPDSEVEQELRKQFTKPGYAGVHFFGGTPLTLSAFADELYSRAPIDGAARTIFYHESCVTMRPCVVVPSRDEQHHFSMRELGEDPIGRLNDFFKGEYSFKPCPE